MKFTRLFLLSAFAGISLVSFQPAQAATFTVQMLNFSFSPAARNINVGDTVIWTNTTATTGHSSTSGSSCTSNLLWSSTLLAGHATFSFTFTNFAPATYPYFCNPHCSIGMVGSLTITNSAIAPPSVSITSPTTGTQLAAPVNITLMANATQTGGTVTNVEFFSGAASLGSDTTSPYSVTLLGAGAGGYSFTAVAKNNQGGASTSAVVNVTVSLPIISITNPVTGSQLVGPTNITLMANATQAGGTVTNVEFRSGAGSLANVTSAPFNFTVNGAVGGNYNFSAVALNNNGGATTSAVVSLSVLTNAVLSNPIFNAGQFRLTIKGIAGQTYATETSSNLIDWTAISTNVAPSDSFDVVDPAATNGPTQYYRARQSF